MKFIDRKTDGGKVKGKIAFYCLCLGVTGFYRYLRQRDGPWKYEQIAAKMRDIAAEDECNDAYGRCRMWEALALRYPDEKLPGERSIYRIMERIGLSHRPKRKPNGITRAGRDTQKSDDLLCVRQPYFPFFPPPLELSWTLTHVESILRFSVSASCFSAEKIFSQMPSSRHLAKRA